MMVLLSQIALSKVKCMGEAAYIISRQKVGR